MSPKIVDKKQKKRDILDAAIALYNKEAIDSTKIETIAKNAGMSKGNFYEYFSSRDDLIIALVEDSIREFEIGFFDHLQKIELPSEKLKFIVAGSLDETFVEGYFLKVWIELLRLASVQKEVKALVLIREYYDKYEEIVSAILSEGEAIENFIIEDKKSLALVIVSQIDALYFQMAIQEESTKVKGIADTFMQTLLKGIIQ
jgi:AcrR family transcriptional regulator